MKRLAIAALLAIAAAAARADDAAALFQAKCKICHGPDGKGAPAGLKMGVKDLTASKISTADAAKVIQDGKGKMTPFKGKLTDAEIQALAAYVAGGLK
ncbi:MAG TPA: cytochrome c [Anaeromyxobacter sp.]|nr:cytochrome c [Anaeromyxobacter sp.]